MPQYDFIGDIHGCYDELIQLFKQTGYEKKQNVFIHPSGRIPVFIGDLTDRGEHSVKTMQLVSEMVLENAGHYVPGNHCNKLYRYFLGRNVKINNGLETTVEELNNLPTKEYEKVKRDFMTLYENAPLYLRLDHDNVIAAHAGIRENLIGHSGKKVQTFVLYGDITGETHHDGRPVRRDWAQHYKGERLIVYGHTPVKQPRVIGKTVNIDTGCVFGGKLTALHYPEMTYTFVSSTMPYVEDKFRSFETESIPPKETNN